MIRKVRLILDRGSDDRLGAVACGLSWVLAARRSRLWLLGLGLLAILSSPRISPLSADPPEMVLSSCPVWLEQVRQPMVKYSGWVRKASPGHLDVDGQLYAVGGANAFGLVPAEGVFATVKADLGGDGRLIVRGWSAVPMPTDSAADQLQGPLTDTPSTQESTSGAPFEFRGLVQEVSEKHWVVGNRMVFVSDRTAVQGRPQPGALADVKGQLVYGGIVLARKITVTVPGANAEVQFEGIIDSYAADYWVVNGVQVRLHATTAIEGSPEVGMLAEVQGILQPDDSVLGQYIRVRMPGFTPNVDLEGRVSEIAPARWVLDGREVLTDRNTFIDESRAPAEVGMWAQVRSLLRRDGSLLALRIRLSRNR